MSNLSSEYVVVLVTASSEEEAVRIATTVVQERLAACANLVPGIRSFFWWEGRVQDEPERLLLIKTRRERFAALEARVRELHSYSVPEVIALPIAEGSDAYLRWIAESTQP